MKKLNYDDVLFRIGYFRNQKKISARELSLCLGQSESYVNRIERKVVEMKFSTLLKILEALEVEPQKFFYDKIENFEADKKIFEAISNLSAENKKTILDIAIKLK